MCVIIELPPGKSIESERLYTAACNNWHSWGIITKDKRGRLQVYRKIPENAELPESDPDCGGVHCDLGEISEILEKNIDKERFVHFRHATKGHINEDNCHPFLVYDKGGTQVYMMHNGGFNGMGVTVAANGIAWQGGTQIDNAPSDTKEFVDKYLTVPLEKFAKGDYTDPAFQAFYWNPLFRREGGGSKVLFVSNRFPTLRVGEWNTFLDENHNEQYYASNDTYFNRITRGPVHQQIIREENEKRKKEQEKAREEALKNGTSITTNNGGNITPYAIGMFQPDPKIVSGLMEVFKSFGSGLEPGQLADLGECSVPEFEAIVNTLLCKGDTNTVACFLDVVMVSYMEMYQELEKIKTKHEGATKKIAELMEEVKKNVPTRSVG